MSISQAEQQLFIKWDATSSSLDLEKCIHQLFEEQVERTPDAMAVIFDGTQLTYRELNERANQLARHLQQLGVGAEVLVGLCVERSLDMVVGLLGILKAGGAYVPLDPAYPKERLSYLVQDARPAVVLTQHRLLPVLPEHHAQVVCLDTDWSLCSQEDTSNIIVDVRPDNLVYVIYTSGSTGSPKGVLIQHQSLVNYALFARDMFEIQRSDRVLQFASINFDASAEEIYPCLISGATLVLRTDAMLNSVATFLHTCSLLGITLLDLPTAYWHEIVSTLVEEELLLPPALRVLIIGGERALPERLRLWQHYGGRHVRLFNTYGPTETTIVVTVAELAGVTQDSDVQPEVSIGKPVANTYIYLLDASLQPVSPGTVGEMYVGGLCLARGYHRSPELTAQRFIPHPFRKEPGACLYKTGDLARLRDDGELEFVGRVDYQVKIRGFRVELEEIESILRLFPAVQDAVVVAREDIPGEKRLVAYVTLHLQHTCTGRDLRLFLKERIPEYMLPSAFVTLDSLPLTPGGKIDRQGLPAPSMARDTDDDDYIAPTSLLHHQLIAIWQDLLHVQPIGIRDNFFYLGGHSLLAARMVARIQQMCGRKLALTTLFAGPTIEQIAESLWKEDNERPRTPVVPVQVGKSERPFFFLHGDPTGGAFYCFQLARSLGEDYPFYALEPYRFDDLPIPPPLETMAAAHIEAMRTVQPRGPYILGGWCDGGLMAYEIARQLQEGGEKVDLLVLMDPAVASRFSSLLHSGIHKVAQMLHFSEKRQIEWFLRLLCIYESVRLIPRRIQEAKVRGSIEETPSKHPLKKVLTGIASLFPSAATLHQNYRNLYSWVSLEYTVGPYAGKMAMILAEEEPFVGIWKRKVVEDSEIRLYFTPGDHMTCRTDHLQELTVNFRTVLSGVKEPQLI